MDYLFEDLPELEIPIAKQQLNCLTDIFYEYTRYGLFVDFDYCPDIHKYQLPYKSLIIGDLTIESPDLEHGATAMICISNLHEPIFRDKIQDRCIILLANRQTMN